MNNSSFFFVHEGKLDKRRRCKAKSEKSLSCTIFLYKTVNETNADLSWTMGLGILHLLVPFFDRLDKLHVTTNEAL